MVAVFIGTAALAYAKPKFCFDRCADEKFWTARAADALHNTGVVLLNAITALVSSR